MLIQEIRDLPPAIEPVKAVALLEHIKRELARSNNTLTARTMITKLQLQYERKL